jgi:hypothetical protein
MNGFRSACAHRFSAYSIECGEKLARASEVIVVEHGPPAFVARVAEEGVSITRAPGSTRMVSTCTCALFALGLDGCRHLWALVAAIDDAEAVAPETIGDDFDLFPLHPPKVPGERSAPSRAPAREPASLCLGLRRASLEGPAASRRRRRG